MRFNLQRLRPIEAAVMVCVLAAVALLPTVGVLNIDLGIMLSVIFYSPLATLAAYFAFNSAKTADGVEKRAWRSLGIGLAAWTLSGALVLFFLIFLGTARDIPSWTQAGYLLAYPFWFRALWSLRQPAPTDSRRGRLWMVATEVLVMILVAVVLSALIWNPAKPADVNASFLIPPVLDVVLFGLFYNAVRRSGISGGGALAWLGYAFGALTVTDVVATYAIVREIQSIGVFVLPGYALAIGLMVVASLRQLRASEAQKGLALSHSAVVAGGLVVAGLAIAVLSGPLQILALGAGAFLAWRVFSAISESGSDDLDNRSGFLSQAAFSRQLQRAIDSDQGLTLVGIDLTGFGVWNARNGFGAGDEMLERVSRSLDSSFSAGVWGRVGPDRFAHLGPSKDLVDDRNTADLLRRRASDAARELPARAGLVRLPEDAESAEQALAALDETLRAAREAVREVVAFGRGDLDGIEMAGGKVTLADRRAEIQDLIDLPESIRPVFQPIVRMADLEVISYEGLSRFELEPSRGPDRWIAEAHAVGLGVDVELECVRRIVVRALTAVENVHISVNASPALVFSRKFETALGDGPLDWLTIEITEHDEVENYSQLAERLGHFRARGAQVAVDDAGAGHSSLRHVMQLRPEWVKLDRSLIQDIDHDPGKRALVRSMVAYNEEIGSLLVAEGVETESEMNTLIEIGVDNAQGYYFARPDRNFVEMIPPHHELAAR